ncbi:MAG: GNAT family N-acetyltransferase, partial [bacterium]
ELEAEFKLLSSNTYIFIIKIKKGIPIGYCYLDNIQYKNSNGEIRISICEKEYRKKGYYIDAYITILRYFFSIFNLHKIYEQVYEFEKEKIETLDELKIKRIAVIPENFFKDDRFWDEYIYNMFAKEFYNGLFQKG